MLPRVGLSNKLQFYTILLGWSVGHSVVEAQIYDCTVSTPAVVHCSGWVSILQQHHEKCKLESDLKLSNEQIQLIFTDDTHQCIRTCNNC